MSFSLPTPAEPEFDYSLIGAEPAGSPPTLPPKRSPPTHTNGDVKHFDDNGLSSVGHEGSEEAGKPPPAIPPRRKVRREDMVSFVINTRKEIIKV